MQTVTAAFTAEEKDSVRKIAHNLFVSWKKQDLLTNSTFTIGVSTIGGGDIIGAIPGGVGSPGQWRYFDESDYVLGLGWERQLNMPIGGLSMALGDAELDNTSGRFLPDYMGGSSELFTSIVSKRPLTISAGFQIGGADITVPQFAGLLKRSPSVNRAARIVNLEAQDYVGFFANKKVDRTALYTGVRTDEIIETLFQQSGMSTSQYDLDTGINDIPFAIIQSGANFSDVINELVQSESGHLFQDEQGVFNFWNRQHFDSSPYTLTQRIIPTSQVINAEAPNEDHIINVVEVTASQWEKQAVGEIFTLGEPVQILASINTEVWVNLDNPVLQVTSQTIAGTVNQDGTGGSISISVISREVFAQSIRYVLSSTSSGYVTTLTVNGREATMAEAIYIRETDSSSLTAYEEKPYSVNNPYVQDRTWAESLALVILDSFGEPENIQKITIRAMPELQLGDLVSWQGRQWRIYSIRARLDDSAGFLQDLVMLKRDFRTYFKIGVSTIGGTDLIAP